MVISFLGLGNTDLHGMTSGYQATVVPGNKALDRIYTGRVQEPIKANIVVRIQGPIKAKIMVSIQGLIKAKIRVSSSKPTTSSSSWRASLQTGISSTQWLWTTQRLPLERTNLKCGTTCTRFLGWSTAPSANSTTGCTWGTIHQISAEGENSPFGHASITILSIFCKENRFLNAT